MLQEHLSLPSDMTQHFQGKILVVDDDTDIVEFISYNLQQKGYEVAKAYDGAEALRVAKRFLPDLILLDVMMPEKDGKETIKIIRNTPELAQTVVIFLTALSNERSEIEGLQLGADDYIGKPIKTELLLTRIASALRRSNQTKEAEDKLVFGDLEINASTYTILYKGEPYILAKKEFELLHFLASKPSRVFLRNEILNKVWGTEVIVGERTIDVHIRKVRQKLGLDLIKTVKGVGYKFEMI